MKLFKLLIVIAPIAFVHMACEDSLSEDLQNEEALIVHSKSSTEREIPLTARFVTKGGPDAFSEMCSVNSPVDFWGLDHQIGNGISTQLGNFTTDMTFCFHVVLGPNGPDFAGGFGDVTDGQGYFEAANGDRLFLSMPVGKVVPSSVEGYKFEFNDTYYFDGGTGRFENASGEFNAVGHVRADDTGTDHIWTGTLILPNGAPSNN